MRWWITTALAISVAGLILLAGGRGVPALASDVTLEGLIDKPAPDFTLTTAAGETVKLSDQKGKVVVLDFWATWCPPCIISLPHVNKIATDKDLAEKGLVVWGINADEAKPRIESFMKKNGYSFAVPIDTGIAVQKSYGIEGLPAQIVIGRDGKVFYASMGISEDSDKILDEAIKQALKKK